MADSTVSVYKLVRGGSESQAATQGTDVRANVNQRGDSLFAQAMSEYEEVVRMGQTWCCRIATASAFTYVADLPTTRAELVLYNGESAGGKIYIIEAVWMANISSMAETQPMTLLVQMVPVMATAIVNDTAQLITSRSGKIAYTGKAQRDLADTTAGQIADKWDVVMTSLVPSPTTNKLAAVYANVKGKYILPPGGIFAMAGVAGTAAGTAIIGVVWTEIQLTLG